MERELIIKDKNNNNINNNNLVDIKNQNNNFNKKFFEQDNFDTACMKIGLAPMFASNLLYKGIYIFK